MERPTKTDKKSKKESLRAFLSLPNILPNISFFLSGIFLVALWPKEEEEGEGAQWGLHRKERAFLGVKREEEENPATFMHLMAGGSFPNRERSMYV